MSMIEWVQTDFKQVEWKEMGWRDSNDTTDFPGSLALLWPSKLTDAGVLKSAKGPAPTYTDEPTLSAGGVVPGDGPSFEDVVAWEDGGTLVVSFTATTASADLVGDVQVFGPLYAASTGLKAMDGTNVVSVATSWEVGDVVTGVVVTEDNILRLGENSITFVSVCNGLTDTIGDTTRDLYDLQYIYSDGTLELASASIVGSETVTSKKGTATVTVSAGKLTIGTGTLWSFALSNGSTYEFCTSFSPTTGVCFDTSGNDRHLMFTAADTGAACLSGVQFGSDWLNQKGLTMSDGNDLLLHGEVPPLTAIPYGAGFSRVVGI